MHAPAAKVSCSVGGVTWIELARGLTREFTKWSLYCMMTSNISANPAE